METKKFRYDAQDYDKICAIKLLSNEIELGDHLGGFGPDYENYLLEHLHNVADNNQVIVYHNQVATEEQKKKYPKLTFKLNIYKPIWEAFVEYQQHPEINYKNFICSFNGAPHVSRKLLTSILQKFGYFDPNYCSKNFLYNSDILDGHIADYASDNIAFYRKFFISDSSEDFFQSVNSFGHVRYKHDQNIYNLETRLTESFLHIVSESMATSYVPFVSEKFVYSVVTRGLFLSYAQPGWHNHVETCYGFKRYTKLFDYRFDSIQNPVERLVELMTMIGKFKYLTPAEWHDLYQLEQDTIEYNYDHYFSGNYSKCLAKYS